MKSRTKHPQTDNISFNANKRPEIRDNLDSRKKEEQDFKGDDVTHNQKQQHHQPRKKNDSQ
jgi:hypothetical protein